MPLSNLEGTKKPASQPPLISIITISFNAAESLERTIKSVLEQSYSNLEHIVIDGGSSDATLQILHQYKEHLKYWSSEPDQGIYDAINKGLIQAQGELVNILNSGDCYVAEILNTISEHYQNHRFQMALCDYYWVYPDRQLQISSNPQILEKGYAVCHQAIFYQRNLHEVLGQYEPDYPLAADYHFIRRVYDQYGLAHIKKAACYYYLGGISETAFMEYAKEVRQICHALKDPFWLVESTYWSKYLKFIIRKILHRLHLDSFLFFYRQLKH